LTIIVLFKKLHMVVTSEALGHRWEV